MRVDTIPEGLLERLVAAAGWLPTPITNVCWGMTQAKVILAALNLGVFDAIAGGARTAVEVAQATSCDAGAMEMLLNGLNGFGLLRRRNGQYRLTKSTSRWLVRSAPTQVVDAVAFGQDVSEMFDGLEEVIRTGRRHNLHEQQHPPEFWRRYMRGLGTFARHTGPEVARKIRFDRPPTRLLDVAGGHGMYSVALCRRWPGLTAEILDLPEAAAVGREIVDEAGFSDRITYRPGDLRSDAWGEGYDGLLLFNILHNLKEEDARATFFKARRALRPGGVLVILDGGHDGGENDLDTAAGFGELFFYVVSSSKTWPEPQLRAWLGEEGFSSIKRHTLMTLPAVLMLTAKAPG